MLFENTDHLHEIKSGDIILEYIHTSRSNVPKNLKKPYEYILPIAEFIALFNELHNFLEPKTLPCEFSKKPKPKPQGIYQCSGVRKKAISKGSRINIFVLGWAYDSVSGATEEQWKETCDFIQNTLHKYLGEDANIYAEKFSKTEKFQARFETYIMYQENQ